MKGSSNELQEVSIVALINDPYLLSKCVSEIKESYFENKHYRIIYRCLRKYYEKYSVVPSEREISLMIDNENLEEFGTKEEISETISKLYSQKVTSDDFMYEAVTEFIRRNRIEGSLTKIVEYVNNGSIDLDLVANELRDSIYVNFNKSKIVNLADVSNIREIRKEALGTTENPVIVKLFIDEMNKYFQYGGLIAGTLNLVVGPPGRGKTTMLINQGVSVAKQGYKILHIFLGDMSRYDGFIRYVSCFTGISSTKLISMGDEELVKFVQKYNMTGFLSNIDIVSYAADQLTANQLIEEITNIQREKKVHYNVIIIDYDENIADEEDNMYKSGGQIYNKMALFAVVNRTVVFIAAQPRKEYWKMEVIPLEAASESSKKQKIVDLMLTLSKPSTTSKCGTISIVKNRRGEDTKLFRISINGANAQMKHILEEEYIRLRQEDSRSS